MNSKATSSSAATKSTPPLRSTTVVRPPATNRASPGGTSASFDAIKLNTYHDSSDLKAALRELEAAFAVPDTSAAPSSPASSSKSSYRAGNAVDRPTNTALKTPAPSTGQPKVTVVVQPRVRASSTSSSPPPLPSRTKKKGGPSSFMQLSSQLMLCCFAFCDLKTLGVLCCVSVRLNVMVEQQGSALWAAAAAQHRIPVANAAASRGELRRALEQRATARNAEEAFYEGEIARMEERLRARAEDVYAQNVDANRTIAAGGDVAAVRNSAASPQPYWLRQQMMAERGLGGGAQGSAPDDRNAITTSQLCAKLRAEIEALEEAKRLCECKINLQEDSLRQQEAQLLQWRALLFSAAATNPASRGGVQSSEEPAASLPLITASQLERFERRIARLVLNGAMATTTTASPLSDSDVGDIPIVFRRGVETFAAVDLVLRVLGVLVGSEHASPPADAPQSGGMQPGTDAFKSEKEGQSPALAAAAREAGKRWRSFQQVCPLNEDYGSVRTYLSAQALREARLAAGPNETNGRPSTKQTPALLRVSGFVRRVEAMTDSQVMQAWM